MWLLSSGADLERSFGGDHPVVSFFTFACVRYTVKYCWAIETFIERGRSVIYRTHAYFYTNLFWGVNSYFLGLGVMTPGTPHDPSLLRMCA